MLPVEPGKIGNGFFIHHVIPFQITHIILMFQLFLIILEGNLIICSKLLLIVWIYSPLLFLLLRSFANRTRVMVERRVHPYPRDRRRDRWEDSNYRKDSSLIASRLFTVNLLIYLSPRSFSLRSYGTRHVVVSVVGKVKWMKRCLYGSCLVSDPLSVTSPSSPLRADPPARLTPHLRTAPRGVNKVRRL